MEIPRYRQEKTQFRYWTSLQLEKIYIILFFRCLHKKEYRILVFYYTSQTILFYSKGTGVLYFTFFTSPNIFRVFHTRAYLLQIWLILPEIKQSMFVGKVFNNSINSISKIYAQDATLSRTNLLKLVWTLIASPLCLNSQTCMQTSIFMWLIYSNILSRILSINEEIAEKSTVLPTPWKTQSPEK